MIENLYRSPTDKWLGGVAGGLAERFGLPTLVVRLLFVVAAVFIPVVHMIIPIVYLVMWLVVPGAPAVEEEVEVAVEEVGEEAVEEAGSEAQDA